MSLLARRVTPLVTSDPTRGPRPSPPSPHCKGGLWGGRGLDQSRKPLSQSWGPMAHSDHLLAPPGGSGPQWPPSVPLQLASQHQERHGGLGLAQDTQTRTLFPLDPAPSLTSHVSSFVYPRRCLLSTYYVPSTVPEGWEPGRIRQTEAPASTELPSRGRGTATTECNVY